MPITDIPGVYYDENVTYELTGDGSKIPIIIGATGNTPIAEVKDENENVTTPAYKVDGSVVRKFYSWDEVNLPCNANNPGICPKTDAQHPDTSYTDETIKTTNNQLAKFLYEFFEEAKLQYNNDIGVPYIYVIDVGDGTSKDAWLKALEISKTKRDAIIEAYVGIDNITNYSVKSFIEAAHTSIVKETHELDLKNGFTTFGYNTPDTVTDEQLIALTAENTGVQLSRIGIIEPLIAGKHFARICVTPANTEPGFYEFRTVEPGTFKDRTKAQMLALQNAGIIFGRDEHVNDEVYPKMNLCVATSFRKTARPADSLFHARFNADDLLREVFSACYKQIKANESVTNIAYLQTRINKIVNDRVSAEEMIKWDEKTGQGTKLTVTQSNDDPYSIVVSGQMHPQKCTIAINVTATLKI